MPAAAWPGEAGEWDVELKFRYGWPKAQDGGVELFDGAYGGEVAVTRRMAARWTLGAGYNLVKLDATGAFRGDYFVENGVVLDQPYNPKIADGSSASVPPVTAMRGPSGSSAAARARRRAAATGSACGWIPSSSTPGGRPTTTPCARS